MASTHPTVRRRRQFSRAAPALFAGRNNIDRAAGRCRALCERGAGLGDDVNRRRDGECQQNVCASAGSGMNRCIHRKTVTSRSSLPQPCRTANAAEPIVEPGKPDDQRPAPSGGQVNPRWAL